MPHDNDTPRVTVRHFLTRARLRAALPYVALGVPLLLAVLLLGSELRDHLDAIESWIQGLGPWGPLTFVAVFVLATSLLVPATLLSIPAGALFGMAWGVAAVVGGSLLAGSVQYALSRHVLREPIERKLAANSSLAAIQRAVKRNELRLQVLLRLSPLNPATISYLLGAAGVRFTGFLTACLALVPGLAIEVYFGHAGKHAARMVGHEQPSDRVHELSVLAAVLGCGIDVAYPREHQRLGDQILGLGGAIVSEYPPGSRPDPWRFPPRNRIIANKRNSG